MSPSRMVHEELCAGIPRIPASEAFEHEDVLSEWLREWLAAHGLVASPTGWQAIAAIRMPLFTAYYSPICRSRDDTRLYCAWMTWLHLFDDRFDAAPLSSDADAAKAVVDHYLETNEALRSGRPSPAPTDPFARAFADLVSWTSRGAGPEWRGRLLSEIDVWMRSYPEETVHRRDGLVLAPDELIALKRRCMADPLSLELLQRVGTGELSSPVRVLLDPLVQLTADIKGAINDIASLERERACGDNHNLVISLMHHRGLSESQATAEVAHSVRQWVAELGELARDLAEQLPPGDERAAAVSWMAASCSSVRGYHDWLLETGRYASA